MIQLRDAAGQHERIAVRHATDTGAQADLLGERKSLGNEQFGRRNILSLRGKMFADPGLAIAKLIQGDNLRQV